jgi:hypothetical protein
VGYPVFIIFTYNSLQKEIEGRQSIEGRRNQKDSHSKASKDENPKVIYTNLERSRKWPFK